MSVDMKQLFRSIRQTLREHGEVAWLAMTDSPGGMLVVNLNHASQRSIRDVLYRLALRHDEVVTILERTVPIKGKPQTIILVTKHTMDGDQQWISKIRRFTGGRVAVGVWRQPKKAIGPFVDVYRIAHSYKTN